MKEIVDWANWDHRKWILEKIEVLEARSQRDNNSPRWGATHKNIWQGCYDVIGCEQDRIDAIEIPKAQIKVAEEEGLIESEIKTWQGKIKEYKMEVWSITELGKKFLKENAA